MEAKQYRRSIYIFSNFNLVLDNQRFDLAIFIIILFEFLLELDWMKWPPTFWNKPTLNKHRAIFWWKNSAIIEEKMSRVWNWFSNKGDSRRTVQYSIDIECQIVEILNTKYWLQSELIKLIVGWQDSFEGLAKSATWTTLLIAEPDCNVGQNQFLNIYLEGNFTCIQWEERPNITAFVWTEVR